MERARFCEMNGCVYSPKFDPTGCKLAVNQWIGKKVSETVSQVEAGISEYRFNEAAGAIYQFAWGTFCDWYLEFAKPILQNDGEEEAAETRATAAWALRQLLLLLHPFMPFISEELWEKLSLGRVLYL